MPPVPEKVNQIRRMYNYFQKIKLRFFNSINFYNSKYAFNSTDRSNVANNTALYGNYLAFWPAGYSLQSTDHYVQIMNHQDERYWAKFDYGKEKNLKK